MANQPDPPDDIMEAAKYIQKMRGKTYMSREDKENLNRAKLRIAYWACRSEGIVATKYNLEYVMGADAVDIVKAYDKYLVNEAERAEREKRERKEKGGKDDGKFWDGAGG